MNAGSPLPQHFSPREIEFRLRQLIRAYSKRSSIDLAVSVAWHIEALCAHPDYRSSWEERCAYRRLAWHWSALAWVAAHPPVRESV
ncbi:MAG TPA: ATP dependent RNA helicase [Candidatus Competibacteraceae bacterium]|nr:ATP dependent RNA helicase [Candidatus Competibacteraceae bacterium]